MSRKRLAFLAACLAAAPLPRASAGDASVTSVPGVDGVNAGAPAADGFTQPPKLVFTYPCLFAYADGKPYPARVLDWDCDYIHASVKGGATYFNKTLPNLAAQQAFLGVVIPKANAAHNDYLNKVADLIKKTDPATLPATLSDADRITKTGALNVELSKGVFEAAEPFLWPPREQESYVSKTAGMWPSSWDPYLQPIYDRAGQLSGMARDSEMKMINQASVDFDAKIRAAELKKTVEGAKAPEAGPALDKLFDGLAASAGVAPVVPPSKAGAKKAKKNSGANVVNALPIPVSDLSALPPPIPAGDAARAQRNYFARGVAAAAERLKDDQLVGLWHAFGLTKTIGDPNQKAVLAFRQDGPSCAVSSVDEALRARGQNISMDKLAQEGLDKGYYVDYETSGGARDGGETDWKNINYLLRDHGVKYQYVLNATLEQLDQAIRNSPQHDAIVDVKIKSLWNDPTVPDGAQHALYITGEEVDTSGKVRGYWANDTGSGEAVRFISAPDFDKAWMNAMVTFPK